MNIECEYIIYARNFDSDIVIDMFILFIRELSIYRVET